MLFQNIIPFRHESASALLMVYSEGSGRVTTLYSTKPGQGHATEVMRQIVKHADEHGLELVLNAKPFWHTRGLAGEDLLNFYRKFGFELMDPNPIVNVGDNFMVRPRKKNHAYNDHHPMKGVHHGRADH